MVESKTVFSYPIHSHSYYEMTLYMPFLGLIRINGTKYAPDTPLISLIAPSDFHVIEVEEDEGAEFIKLRFDADLLDGSLKETASMVLKGIENSDIFIKLFHEIRDKKDCKYSRFLLNAMVCALRERGEAVVGNPISSPFSLLSAAILKIQSDFSKNLTLSSVAAALGITPQYLSRLFCKNAGLGFSAFLAQTRLEKAGFYLKETKLSVTDIAYEVGYRDLSHFMRSFKRYYGTTPHSYRKEP
jgi:AraC-like DNA-binding protein